MNALVDHVASGQAFFWARPWSFFRRSRRSARAGDGWRCRAGRSPIAGILLIAVSSTPLPMPFYAAAGTVSLVWIGVEGSTRTACGGRDDPPVRGDGGLGAGRRVECRTT